MIYIFRFIETTVIAVCLLPLAKQIPFMKSWNDVLIFFILSIIVHGFLQFFRAIKNNKVRLTLCFIRTIIMDIMATALLSLLPPYFFDLFKNSRNLWIFRIVLFLILLKPIFMQFWKECEYYIHS